MKTTALLIEDFKAGFKSIAGRKPLMGDDYILHLLATAPSGISVYQCGMDCATKMLRDGWQMEDSEQAKKARM